MLAAFECQSEWNSFKENVQNATGNFCGYSGTINETFWPISADRLNASHFVDMKKNGSLYRASDGSSSIMFENVNHGEGDCVVFKNGGFLAAPCNQAAYFVCENE
jgi:hypothetical protein